MIFFYNKNDGKVYSYICYNLVYNGETLLNRPSVEKCASNNSVSESDIKIAKLLIENPTKLDLKDDVDDLDSEDYEDI